MVNSHKVMLICLFPLAIFKTKYCCFKHLHSTIQYNSTLLNHFSNVKFRLMQGQSKDVVMLTGLGLFCLMKIGPFLSWERIMCRLGKDEL